MKNSVGQGTATGTIQENSKGGDYPGNNFSGVKSKENAPITGGLRNTIMERNVLGTWRLFVLVVVAIELFVIVV